MPGEQVETPAAGQPNGKDPSPGASLQDGGITPLIAGALAKLPPEEAAAVRAEVAQRNAELTKHQQLLASQRQQLARDVEMANVLREASRDPDFAAFLEARQRGNLPEFYRQRSGVATPAGNQRADNPAASVAAHESAGAQPAQAAPAHQDASELARRVMEIESAQRRDANQREIERFTAQHPDYEAYLPAMTAVRSRLPNASLRDLYLIAKSETGAVPHAAQSAHQSAPPAANTPPPPTSGGATSQSQSVLPKPKTVREAFQQAKGIQNLPTDREVVFQFN